ncbi:uncharacterized protein TNCV_4642731 [Trichonephila clavipes]|nr:uncharacterized protein TNCV_4642731 [Trichonephila clavipes]
MTFFIESKKNSFGSRIKNIFNPLNWGGTEPNHTVTCMVLKATVNDRRLLALCHDEFRGPRSGLCRSGDISKNNSKTKVLYCSTKNSTSCNKIMKQEMQLFDSTENPAPNIIKLCEALKIIPPTSVGAERAFFAASQSLELG